MTGRIKIVLRVKNFVAVKDKSGSVELIHAAFGDGIDHRAGGAAVLRRVVAGQHRKFLNAVNSQIQPGCAARRTIGIVVDADAVYAIGVLVRAVPSVAQLISKSTIAFVGAETSADLVGNTGHSRLERCQRSPVASV